MRLTDHTDYCLRSLMYMNQKKSLVTLNELSDILNISKNNLIKVSNQLAKLGLIESSQGRFGGLKISESAGSKSLREIISATEQTFNIAECFSGKSDCTFLNGCKLKKTLENALDSFLLCLEATSLDDITKSPRSL